MADPLSVAASVIGIAAFGIQIVKTLTTFTNVYRGAEQKIKSLTADVALTSSILKSIGETIDTYEKECRLTVENFIATRDTCHRNFDVLLVALRVVKKESAGDGVAQVKKIDMWVKLKQALGGEQELKDLVASIETSKSNLQLLLDSLNLTILRSLSKKNLLSDEQADDFKLFMRHLPALVRSIQQAGLMPMPAYKGKDKIEHNKDDSVSVTMYVVGPTVGTDDPPDYVQDEAKGVEDLTTAVISPDLKRRVVFSGGEQDTQKGAPAKNPNTKLKFKRRAVSLEGNKEPKEAGIAESLKRHDLAVRVSLDSFRDESTIEKTTPDDLAIETVSTKRRQNNTGLFGLFKQVPDDSLEKTHSTDVCDPVMLEKEIVQKPIAQQAAPSREQPNATNIFERWLLAPEIPASVPPSVFSICGLRIRVYARQEQPDYKTSFLSRDETVLEAWLPNLSVSGVKRHVVNLAELPSEARHAVEALLDDRNNSTNKPHSWKVEFISPYIPQQETELFFWQRRLLRKDTVMKWMVLLRGGIFSSEEATGRDSIERYRDPWSDEVKLGAEELRSSDFILGEPRNMKKSKYRRMMEPEQVSLRGSQSVPIAIDAFDDIKRPEEEDWSGWARIKKKKKKKTRVSVGAITREEHSKSSMPGGFDDDLDFTATVSAGLQDIGFDPDIVIDDPQYRRRDSSPVDSEPKKVKFPHDLNYSPKGEGPGNEHYFERKLSKKERKKRDKAARRSNLEFEDTRSVVKKPGNEVLDPELTQPQFRPSIDRQYGDLPSLPPSESTSHNVESVDDLPRLPDSRPETAETERTERRARRTSKIASRDSSINSPSQMHRPRPTSWDNTKEFKPLYLVERKTLGSGVQRLADDKPFPELGKDGWGAVAAGVAGAAAVLAEERRKEEELDSARSRRNSRARNDSISSLGGSDFGKESRWRHESSGHEAGSEEMLSEEQAERLMSAYLDTFTADGGDE